MTPNAVRRRSAVRERAFGTVRRAPSGAVRVPQAMDAAPFANAARRRFFGVRSVRLSKFRKEDAPFDGLAFPAALSMGGYTQQLTGGGTRTKYGVANALGRGPYWCIYSSAQEPPSARHRAT